MLAAFQTVATQRVANIQAPADGLMRLFVQAGHTYMGIPVGWDGSERRNQQGDRTAPYLLLSLTPATQVNGAWVPQGNPVTFRANSSFLAEYGIIDAASVRTVLQGQSQYVIRCEDGGEIEVRGRRFHITNCTAFIEVDDSGLPVQH